MMIDDEPITLEIIQMFLEDAGYEQFVLTSDPRHAIETLERERPDIVLLDLMMPDVTGFDILAYVRQHEHFKHLPVVVLTSSTDAPTKLKALEMGATDFLAKPVDESELVLRVRNTLAAKAYQDRLAYFDRLTGLPNRHMLLDRLDWAMKHAQRYGQTGALLLMDVNRFRAVNQALGPARGDELLRAIAGRLEETSRASDVVALLSESQGSAGLSRLGGDEFTLMLLGQLTPENIARVAKRVLDSMAAPFHLDGQELFVTVNIGITTFPADGDNIDATLHNASIAVRSLQSEQSNPHGAFRFYSSELNAQALSRLDLETDLRHALERRDFEVYYQPKYDVATEMIIGAECLLRWHHAERGFVSPVEFIPVAEETGLIVDLGAFVLDDACRQLAEWSASGHDIGNLAINVSAHQFRHQGFVDTVRDALIRHAIPAGRITLELTESLLMSHADRVSARLGELREIGVQLSIDDFGTGYSSLAYLRTLPIDELKIDRCFLNDVETDQDSAAIVRAIIALAHSLDLTVVAEGIETVGQLSFLRAHACQSGQGFLFSRPVPAKQFEALLAPISNAKTASNG